MWVLRPHAGLAPHVAAHVAVEADVRNRASRQCLAALGIGEFSLAAVIVDRKISVV